MTELFSCEGTDKKYIAVREDPKFRDIKEECNRLWRKFKPYADPDFIDQFPNDFDGRFWEMYLGEKLLDYHPPLESSGSGPDFVVPGVALVEATVSSRGEDDNTVPSIEGEESSVLSKECLMRVTHSLSKKAKKAAAEWSGYCEPLVIAINLPFREVTLYDPPLAAQVTLGCYNFSANLSTKTVETSSRRDIQKTNGSLVDVAAFADPESKYKHVSALIVASVSPFFCSNYPYGPLELLHNPQANKPLPRGFLPIGREYWVEGNSLMHKKHKPSEKYKPSDG